MTYRHDITTFVLKSNIGECYEKSYAMHPFKSFRPSYNSQDILQQLLCFLPLLHARKATRFNNAVHPYSLQLTTSISVASWLSFRKLPILLTFVFCAFPLAPCLGFSSERMQRCSWQWQPSSLGWSETLTTSSTNSSIFFPSLTCHEQISILVIRWSKDSRKSMRTHCYWPERKRLELKPKHLRTNWGKNDGPQNVHGKDHDNAMRMAQRAYLWTFVNTEMWLSAHACPTTIPVIVALKFVLMPRLKEIIESFGEAASFQENSGNVINSFFSNI